MTPLQIRVVEALDRLGRAPDTLVRAPGRVNIIGEHTDYNDGFVLPCAINFETVIAAARRSDDIVRALAVDGQMSEFQANQPIRKSAASWSDYVRGAVDILREQGFDLGGADLVIGGDIPQGAGLSSSASLLVGIIATFADLFGLPINPTKIAVLAQRAENEFVGVNVGIMDQLISARGMAGHALLIDCRDLSINPIKIPADTAIMIVNSGIRRGLVESAYNERRRQCATAAQLLDVRSLRDLSPTRLEAGWKRLDDVVYRRARHVVTENERVLEACEALRSNDLAKLGKLMAASHASMRDDFEITVPRLDALVDLLNKVIAGNGGARMTGGGFGGCVVAVLERDEAQRVRDAVLAGYETPDGSAPEIYLCTAEAGVSIIR